MVFDTIDQVDAFFQRKFIIQAFVSRVTLEEAYILSVVES